MAINKSKFMTLENTILSERTKRKQIQNEFNNLKVNSNEYIEHIQNEYKTLLNAYETLKNQQSCEHEGLITDLKQIIAEQEKDIAILTEEKRFYQLELTNKELTDVKSPIKKKKNNIFHRSPSPEFNDARSRTPSPVTPMNDILFPENYFPRRELDVIWENEDFRPEEFGYKVYRSKSLELPSCQNGNLMKELSEEFHIVPLNSNHVNL